MPQADVEQIYRRRTPTSAQLTERSFASMPGGNTRTLSWYWPYPIAFERGRGSYLWDLDGNRYIDLFYNGLSLIHGHAYPPIVEAMRAVLDRGTAWPAACREQIEFAELLCRRIASIDVVRFTNSGTEAGMLAVKIARAATGRPIVVKASGGYHGSYDDLEAGLYGQGDIPGRVLLGEFGDAESFERVLEEQGDQIAAVVLEPIMYSWSSTPPPPDFLTRVQAATRRAGALFVLDDCLMFRLAEGGAAEKYGLDPDITFLGKFIGGGVPVGAVGGRASVMSVVDPRRERHLYHGGSFNGHLLGCAAGIVAVSHLTAERIAKMDYQAARLRAALEAKARDLGIALIVSGEGSSLGVYLAQRPRPTDTLSGQTLGSLFHLATLNHGIYIGAGGEVAMATVLSDDDLDAAIGAFESALEDVAAQSSIAAVAG